MTKHLYTTQAQVRSAFWEAHPNFSRAKHERAPNGHCDTRCAFVDFVDMIARNGEISEALAQRVTL